MTWQRISLITFIACVSLLPFWVFGAEGEGYVRLTGLPNSDINDLSTEGFINALYLIAISIAAFLAVGRLIFAGVKIMLSGANVTSKEDAKRDIQGALLGLLIVIGAVLILTTINPQLTNFDFLRNAPSVNETLQEKPVEVVGGDALDQAQLAQSCQQRADEGYEYRRLTSDQGLSSSVRGICCKPNGEGIERCPNTTNTVETVTVDTGKVYTQEEYSQLLSDLRNTSSRIEESTVIGATISDSERSCTAREGEHYVLQRRRSDDFTIDRKSLCVFSE